MTIKTEQIIAVAKETIAERSILRARVANTLNTYAYTTPTARLIAKLTFDESLAKLNGKIAGLVAASECISCLLSGEIIELDRVASLNDNEMCIVRDCDTKKICEIMG